MSGATNKPPAGGIIFQESIAGTERKPKAQVDIPKEFDAIDPDFSYIPCLKVGSGKEDEILDLSVKIGDTYEESLQEPLLDAPVQLPTDLRPQIGITSGAKKLIQRWNLEPLRVAQLELSPGLGKEIGR